MLESEAESLLKERSLRVTRPRVAVLSVIHASPHADPTAIITQVRGKSEAVSTQTVYVVLNTLVDAHIARRIAVPNGGARYEIETGDNHQHVACRDCVRIHDVADPGTSTPLSAGSEHGFEIDNIEVTFWGLCPQCRAGQPTTVA